MALTFDDACENPELRQEFLDGIDLEWAKPYVSSVHLVPDQILYDGTRSVLMYARAAFRTRLFKQKGLKSTIGVHQISFNRAVHITEDDFLSTLIDHEGTHAKDAYFHPKLTQVKSSDTRFSEDMLMDTLQAFINRGSARDLFLLQRERIKHLMEMRACAFQLESGRAISEGYKEQTDILFAYADRQHAMAQECIKRCRDEAHDQVFGFLERYMSHMMDSSLRAD